MTLQHKETLTEADKDQCIKAIQHFDSIEDCPIFNWEKCIETGDLRYLLRLKSYRKLQDISSEVKSFLQKVFKDISSQIIDEFGISESQDFIYNKQKDYLKKSTKYLLQQSVLVRLKLYEFADENYIEAIAFLFTLGYDVTNLCDENKYSDELNNLLQKNKRLIGDMANIEREINRTIKEPKEQQKQVLRKRIAMINIKLNSHITEQSSIKEYYTHVELYNDLNHG